MACYHPKHAWVQGRTQTGKQNIVFKVPDDKTFDTPDILIPCGSCIGCKVDKSREWALRIMHETLMHEDNCFITLTYNDKYLPEDRCLDKETLKKFIKRLRKQIYTEYGQSKRIKLFAGMEYGDKNLRPHYHIIIMGYDFPAKYWLRTTATGNDLFDSPFLQKLWTDPDTKESYGFTSIGEVTFESAAYVARYCFKKSKDKNGYELTNYDPDTGEILGDFKLTPEGDIKSPGIGKEWWKKFKADTYKDYFNYNGKYYGVPRYYDKLLEKENEDLINEIKERRVQQAKLYATENTPERRIAKEKIKQRQVKQLKRSIK